MGIFGAMLTAVSGLQAQSYALENISGNIANSQTSGYKRVDTSFVDLITEQPARRELAGSVSGYSRLTNTIQGDLRSTGVATNMALSGEGYFVVQERAGTDNNQPIFRSGDLYTRRGDFATDANGYLVNGSGYYLKGSSIDPVTGQIKGAGSSLIQLGNQPLPAKATTEIKLNADLPSSPSTIQAQSGGSPLLASPSATITGANQSTFLEQTVTGGSVIVYDPLGTPVSVQLRWGKTANGTAGPPATSGTWNAYYQTNSAATGTTPAWINLGQDFTFGLNGNLTSTSPTSVSISNLTVDGVRVNGQDAGGTYLPVKLDFGVGGLTQYSSSGGLVQASNVQQDGYPSATLDSVSVSTDGRISGSYSNGRVVPLAQVAVAQFTADNALKRRDGGVYEQTLESGLPLVGTNGANVLGGLVEGSNTDVADEFAKMIVTQQAYSANTRVVTTSQQMLSDVLNMVR